MLASGQDHPDVVKALLAAGADANAIAIVSTLFQGPSAPNQTPVQTPRGGMTPLMFAARQGSRAAAAALLEGGADIR